MLKLAAEADTRKDALVDEVRVQARQAKEGIERERAEVHKEKDLLEVQKREFKE